MYEKFTQQSFQLNIALSHFVIFEIWANLGYHPTELKLYGVGRIKSSVSWPGQLRHVPTLGRDFNFSTSSLTW